MTDGAVDESLVTVARCVASHTVGPVPDVRSGAARSTARGRLLPEMVGFAEGVTEEAVK